MSSSSAPAYALASLCLAVSMLLCPARTSAQSSSAKSEMLPIGFSNLVFRLEDDDEIRVAREDFKVFLLEAMREHGLNAVGTEDLVFGKDRSEAARLTLGGVSSCVSRRAREVPAKVV